MAKKSKGGRSKTQDGAGIPARKLALKALLRIEKDGAFSNLVLPEILKRSDLSTDDKRFVTELVYGTTRMRRACDFLVNRYLLGDADPQVRAALRLGAYQLHYLRTPAHAAVDATVGAVTGRGGSLVNAVLRKVAAEGDIAFPDLATELSYPDWIVECLCSELGDRGAIDSLRSMNNAATTSVRDDGYIQDPASQQVVDLIDAQAGETVVDLCAAPGGKATGLAALGAHVIAADLRYNRSRLISRNIKKLKSSALAVNADGLCPPIRENSVDKVLIDAPCSGLGSLRRRADARWRIGPDAPERLSALQTELVISGLNILKPGGVLTYSVCTLTKAEGRTVLENVRRQNPSIDVVTSQGPAWALEEGVAQLLPDDTDGMTLWQVQKPNCDKTKVS